MLFLILYNIIIIRFLFFSKSEKSKNNNKIELTQEEINFYNSLPEIRFSSFQTLSDKGYEYKLKMKVPYSDDYEITIKNISSLLIYKSDGELLTNLTKSGKLNLKKDQIIFLNYKASSLMVDILSIVKPLNHDIILPYEPQDNIDISKFDTSSILYDPLKPAELKYTKRNNNNMIYINDNNPEELTIFDVNKAQMRTNITNKEVFFTAEHRYKESENVFYGYQVINKGKNDLYITVKNIGYQLYGSGNWLGEEEWINFYNTKFKLLYKDKWTESQKNNFNSHFGFCDCYEPLKLQPITYRIPPKKHIYVIGGTSIDSYNNINVFNTADKSISGKVSSGLINGVVLFNVYGEAEGVIFLYDDYRKVQEDNLSDLGLINSKPNDTKQYGHQYKGYDNIGGVIDNTAIWEFNDLTKSQNLPIIFKTFFQENVPENGEIYGIINSTDHIINNTKWYTHLNPNQKGINPNDPYIGNDMTKYIIYNGTTKEQIIIDNDHYDGYGNLSNLGNWMIDYIDTFVFINRGSKERNITINMKNSGAIAAMVRNSEGIVEKGTEQFSIGFPKNEYGDAITEGFEYNKTIQPHTAVKIYVEYNLLANSYGTVTHYIYLD